jgi:hypothetical protein
MYEQSTAAAFVKTLTASCEAAGAKRGTPEYEAAPWGFEYGDPRLKRA